MSTIGPFSFSDTTNPTLLYEPYYTMNIDPGLLLSEFQGRFPPDQGVYIRQGEYSFEARVPSHSVAAGLVNLRVPFNSVDALTLITPTAQQLVDSILMSISRFDQRALENLYLLTRPSLLRLQCEIITRVIAELHEGTAGIAITDLIFGTMYGTGCLEYTVSTTDYSQVIFRESMSFSERDGLTLLNVGVLILHRLNQMTRTSNNPNITQRPNTLADRLLNIVDGRNARQDNASRFLERQRERESEQAAEVSSIYSNIGRQNSFLGTFNASSVTLNPDAISQASISSAQIHFPQASSRDTFTGGTTSSWVRSSVPISAGPEFKEDYLDRLLLALIPRLTLTTTARLDGTELSVTTRLFAKMSNSPEPVEIDFIDDVVDLEDLKDE